MVYTISTGFAIYFVLWWIVLFLTLPFGVRSQHEDGEGPGQVIPGTDPGAPVAPRMGRKLIWTTLISALLYAASMLAYNAGYLNVERLSKLLGMPI
jgi:predicted secreted protein